jgi:hypothetical protein
VCAGTELPAEIPGAGPRCSVTSGPVGDSAQFPSSGCCATWPLRYWCLWEFPVPEGCQGNSDMATVFPVPGLVVQQSGHCAQKLLVTQVALR